MEHYLVYFVDSEGDSYNKGIFSYYFQAHEFVQSFDFLENKNDNCPNIKWAVIEK